MMNKGLEKMMMVGENTFVVGQMAEYRGITADILMIPGKKVSAKLNVPMSCIEVEGATMQELFEKYVQMVDEYLDR